MVVQGQGPGPRYGHVMDLVGQRYLVTVSGNDGKTFYSFAFNCNLCLGIFKLLIAAMYNFC